ncbi:MAG: MlaD family protein [Desulfovibrio sp.]|jgi:phospholipid/cholesterol/gamma-HCH transport system substrate-binding protein|nr:MlaD family protein [Desulfovibrio sp.]
MEIRANYLLVGVFALAVTAAMAGFVLWLASRSNDTSFREYDICFTESVKGLSTYSDVLFVGIKVGTVKAITISKENPGEVRVRIAIDDDAPVREDSAAQLEPRGITGTTIINISGGTADSPLLNLPPGKVGAINTVPSPFSSVLSRMPDVISGAEQVLAKLDALLGESNLSAASGILESGKRLIRRLEKEDGPLESFLDKWAAAAEKLDRTLDRIDRDILPQVQSGSAAMNRAMTRADAGLTLLEPGLRQFSTQGLADLRALLSELRNLAQALSRTAQKLDNDPRRFFFGEQHKEYRNK